MDTVNQTNSALILIQPLAAKGGVIFPIWT